MKRFIQTVISELSALDTSTLQLRKFGVLISAVSFLLLGFLMYTKGDLSHVFLTTFGVIFLLATLVLPRILLWSYYVWMGLAIVLGFFIGEIMLTILFFFVVSPLAIIRRMVRKTSSEQKETNWTPITGTQASQKMDRLF